MLLYINKKIRAVIILILFVIVSFISIALFIEIKFPKVKEETTALYNYSNKAFVDYEVLLKPSNLYDKQSIVEGQLYITKFVDSIKATFNYEFSSDTEAAISGSYSIIARVLGTVKIDQEKNDFAVWQKDFILMPNKTFSKNDNTALIKEDIDISLSEYDDFAEHIAEVANVDTNAKLNVFMVVNIEGAIGKDSFEEKLSSSMVIPLNTSMFQITGNLAEVRPGKIEETRQIQLPIDKNKVMLYGIILVILLIGLIFLIFFTKPAPDKDPLEKTIQLIFKKHGDRFISLNSNLTINNSRALAVRSIDDLVRASDEVNKPIMYKYNDDYRKIDKFYVVCGEEIYVLYVKDILQNEQGKTGSNISKPYFADENNLEL